MPRLVRVRYYAQLREALRTSGEDVPLELPARENDILESLARLHPRQRDLFLASRVAVEEDYPGEGDLIDKAESLDIISPVSGG